MSAVLLCSRQILATRTESQELVGALSTLSTFYEENTPVARRRLRTTIEQHGLSITEQFTAAAKAIIQVDWVTLFCKGLPVVLSWP